MHAENTRFATNPMRNNIKAINKTKIRFQHTFIKTYRMQIKSPLVDSLPRCSSDLVENLTILCLTAMDQGHEDHKARAVLNGHPVPGHHRHTISGVWRCLCSAVTGLGSLLIHVDPVRGLDLHRGQPEWPAADLLVGVGAICPLKSTDVASISGSNNTSRALLYRVISSGSPPLSGWCFTASSL